MREDTNDRILLWSDEYDQGVFDYAKEQLIEEEFAFGEYESIEEVTVSDEAVYEIYDQYAVGLNEFLFGEFDMVSFDESGSQLFVIVNDGLWDGRHHGIATFKDAALREVIEDTLRSDYECTGRLYLDKESKSLMISKSHHDGTNYYTLIAIPNDLLDELEEKEIDKEWQTGLYDSRDQVWINRYDYPEIFADYIFTRSKEQLKEFTSPIYDAVMDGFGFQLNQSHPTNIQSEIIQEAERILGKDWKNERVSDDVEPYQSKGIKL